MPVRKAGSDRATSGTGVTPSLWSLAIGKDCELLLQGFNARVVERAPSKG